MNERDIMQSGEEQENESLESTEKLEGTRGLEKATYEPGARVEEAGSYKESEAIEASVTDLVDTGSPQSAESQVSKVDSFTKERDIGATPQPIPNVLDKGEEGYVKAEPGEEGFVKAKPGEEIYAKIKDLRPVELPTESSEDEVMLDGKGSDSPEDLEKEEIIDLNHKLEAEPPVEMPPELSEDMVIRKRPGKENEEVEFKFFKPIPAEEDQIAEVGKISGPNPKTEEEVNRDSEEGSGRGA